jgi:hypothetical protein
MVGPSSTGRVRTRLGFVDVEQIESNARLRMRDDGSGRGASTGGA